VIVKEVNHIRCFAIYIANILYSFPVVLPKASEINRNDLLEYKEKKSTNGFPLFSLTIPLWRKIQALSVPSLCLVVFGAYSFYPNGLAEWDTLKTVLRMATTG
jgi:hypothetical protein